MTDTYPDTEPGPQCATGSRPYDGKIERRRTLRNPHPPLLGWCSGCQGMHPATRARIGLTIGWWINPHQPSEPTATTCANPGCSTVFDPPRYSGPLMDPLCSDCLTRDPDAIGENGEPIWDTALAAPDLA